LIIQRTTDVFGIQRDLPLNYVERESADKKLISNLSRGKHLVIYGGSKQGKTSLRKNCLLDHDYVTVQCLSSWSLQDLHVAVLKQAGYSITQSTTKTQSGKYKLLASISATFFGASAHGAAESERTSTTATVSAPLEFDADDPNDVVKALQTFKKYIVLEDFHYLPIETQKEFASALKAFHEISPTLTFIIVGVWLEEGRLTAYNGDLNGRVVPISADEWTPPELEAVIKAGERLLNISFPSRFVTELLDSCFNSVYLLQEACYRACEESGIVETKREKFQLPDALDARKIVKDVVNDQKGRYQAFITQFVTGFQDTTLEMYKWLLYPVLTANTNTLEQGLSLAQIGKSIRAHHPQGSGLNTGNVTQALQACASLQVKKNIRPIILDYDQTNLRLRVVDKGFLIWLANQTKEHVLDLAGLPVDR